MTDRSDAQFIRNAMFAGGPVLGLIGLLIGEFVTEQRGLWFVGMILGWLIGAGIGWLLVRRRRFRRASASNE